MYIYRAKKKKDSNYSVFKAARMYKMHFLIVDSLIITGVMDCDDFKAKLLVNKGKPAIINVNVCERLLKEPLTRPGYIETLKAAGFSEDRFYIHCDGALFELMMSFVERESLLSPIGSISVSGHKFIGCTVRPTLCGGCHDHGTRNGHAPIFLWYTLNSKGYGGLKKEVQTCLRNARYLKDRLCSEGIEPIDGEFVRRWQLPCQGNIAHVLCVMPNVTIMTLDEFLNDLIMKRSIWLQDRKVQPTCTAVGIGKENCACL
ncbi:hypothetical protein MKW92_040146 [Papaver armeniacum]|nr:hypothetical protein MKW92_040146 [Papaver armeniacum]